MSRHVFWTLLIVAMIPGTPGVWGCAKRSGEPQSDSAAVSESSAPGDALLEVSREDATPMAPPSLTPAPFGGPPLKPRVAPSGSYQGEAVAPPAAVPDSVDGSSSSSDEAARRQFLESEPSSPGYVSPTLQIDPARFFRRRDDWTEAEVAADALGRIGAAAAAEAIAMLDDPSPTVRRRGAEILAHIGADAEEAIEPLIRTLEQDPDPQVRKAAAYALGQMGPQAAAAVPALTNMLRKPGR